MIPAAFTYRRAGSAEEAVALLAEHGEDCKLLAGGQSLLPLMKLRLAAPEVLVDVGRVQDLSGVRDAGDHLAIGALTRHRDLERDELLAEHAPLLRHAAKLVGDPQVRARGTLGGSLAHADPSADLPAVLLALDGTLVARGPDGQREVAAADFFTGFLETALAPDELLVEVRVPKQTGGWGYEKFRRRALDWAMVGAAVQRRNGDVAVALMNMGPTPLRATGVEKALAGGASVADAAAQAAEGTSPSGDLHASAEYRSHLARVLVGRALAQAA